MTSAQTYPQLPDGSPDWKEIEHQFAEPFPPEEVGSYDSGHGVFSFVNARGVAGRLDDVVGMGNWSTAYTVVGPNTGAVECRLTVLGVQRADVGYPNNPIGKTNQAGKLLEDEPLKAAYSDAFKRAAVHFKIGAYLYPKAGTKGQQQGGYQQQGQQQGGYQQNGGYQQQGQQGQQQYQASPNRPASDKQKALVLSLCQQLNYAPPADIDQYTSAKASEVIQKLQAMKNGGQPQQQAPQQQAPPQQQFNAGPLTPTITQEEADNLPFSNGAASPATTAASNPSQKPSIPAQERAIAALCEMLKIELIAVPPTFQEATDLIQSLNARMG